MSIIIRVTRRRYIYNTLIDGDPGVENPTISQQWHEARFILGIKEQHVVSQAAVDHIISSTTTLVSTLLDGITAGVHSTDPQELLKVIEESL